MAAGGLKILREIMTGQSDDYHQFWHVACGCSAHLNMCGGIVAAADIDFVDLGERRDTCCPPCLEAWLKHGCPRCGICGPDGLCGICQQQTGTD